MRPSGGTWKKAASGRPPHFLLLTSYFLLFPRPPAALHPSYFFLLPFAPHWWGELSERAALPPAQRAHLIFSLFTGAPARARLKPPLPCGRVPAIEKGLEDGADPYS